MTKIEDALKLPATVAAWDINLEADGTRCLTVFDVSRGAKRIASRAWPDAEVSAITAGITAGGAVVGEYDGVRPFVWRATAAEVQAWNADKMVLDARDGVIRDSIGREYALEDVRAIVGYAADDYVDRGVAVELADGRRRSVVYELSGHAGSDPTYNRNDFLMDSEWISAMGAALGRWAGRPFRGA